MDTGRWQQVEKLFHAAIELNDSHRDEFLRQQCGDDPALRAEVESLIRSSSEDQRFLDDSLRPVNGNDLERAVGTLADKLTRRDTSELSVRNRRRRTIDSRRLAALVSQLDSDLEFRQVIGEGGMGTVVRAFDRSLCRDVAVKLFPSELNDRQRQQIVEESRAIARLHSDHIVTIHRAGRDSSVSDGSPWLVMELIDGPSVREVLAEQHQLPPREAARILSHVARGLAAAHAESLIHRDVKPGNILLQRVDGEDAPRKQELASRRALLIDFGLVQRDSAIANSVDEQRSLAGTPAYMSPEQLHRTGHLDHRTDIYSAGATLYEMLTGQQPWRGAPHVIMRRIAEGDPVRPRELDDRIPLDLESICLKAMSRNRDDRYATALDLQHDLERFLNNEPTVARPVSHVQRMEMWCRRNPWLATSLALAALVVLTIGLGGVTFGITVAAHNREIIRQRELAFQARIAAVIDAEPAAVPVLVTDLNVDRHRAREFLQQRLEEDSLLAGQRFNGLVAVSLLGQPQTEQLMQLVPRLFASPAVCRSLVGALQTDAQSRELLYRHFQNSGDETTRVRLAIINAHLGDWRGWNLLVNSRTHPDEISAAIHAFSTWHGDLAALAAQWHGFSEDLASVHWSLAQAVGTVDPQSLHARELEVWRSILLDSSNQARDPGLRSSARWALARWKVSPKELTPAPQANSPAAPVTTAANGTELVRIEAQSMMIGRLDEADLSQGWEPHRVTITRPFYMAVGETTVAEYRSFLDDPACPDNCKPAGFSEWQPDQRISPDPGHPAQLVSWIDAVLYCNWLSEREALRSCYVRGDEPIRLETPDGTIELENWRFDGSADGYRLPTDTEWEIACRAGSQTRWYFGEDPELLPWYVVSSNHRSQKSVATFECLPNRYGLFQMHGNVWEWCHDWYANVGRDPLIDPTGPPQPSQEVRRRVYRGGGIATLSGDVYSGSRGAGPPDARFNNLGFRVARTIIDERTPPAEEAP